MFEKAYFRSHLCISEELKNFLCNKILRYLYVCLHRREL